MRLKKVSGWWWNSVESWHLVPQIWIGLVADLDGIYIFVAWLKAHFIFYQEDG